MGKKKKGISENMRRKSVPSVSVNKFEFKVNRQKNKVLGQRASKHDSGMPGISKSRSIKKRMETLLVDLKKSRRVNSFEDGRISIKDASEEDNALARFKLKHKKAAQIFNLNEEEDEEEMTHAGQRISQLSTFDAPILSDEDDGEDVEAIKMRDQALSSKYTEDNFGGGFLSRMRDDGGGEMSHKDRMAQLVMQSIVDKSERRRDKEQQQEKIDCLNNKMKLVLPQLSGHMDRRPGTKLEPLDLAVRMLDRLPRGRPSEKVKSKQEVQEEEELRVAKEEGERLERMQAPSVKRRHEHLSADAHGDEPWLDASKKSKMTEEESDNGLEDEESDDDEDDDDEDDDDEDDDDEEDEDEEDEDEEDEDEDKDSEEEYDEITNDGDFKKNNVGKYNDDKEYGVGGAGGVGGDGLEGGQKDAVSGGVVGGVACFIDSVKSKSDFLLNLSKLQKKDIWTLMEFLKASFLRGTQVWDSLQDFATALWLLCRKDPVEAGKAFRHFLFDAQADFHVRCDHKHYGSLPSSPFVYCMLHLTPTLFPPSDHHHPVCTPLCITLSHFLAMSRVVSLFDVAAGLHLTSILFTCCQDDKRWMPEGLNFLHSILLLHSQHHTLFKKKNRRGKLKNLTLLQPSTVQTSTKYEGRLRVRDMFGEGAFVNAEEFKMESLGLALKYTCNFMRLYTRTPAFCMLFRDHVKLLAMIAWDVYPLQIRELRDEVLRCYEDGRGQGLRTLRVVEGLPKGITMLEPELADKLGGGHRTARKEHEDRKRVARKEKRGEKDVKRRIRKDQAFLNQHILHEKIAKNKERDEKTRRILNDLAEQEGWYKQANKKKDTTLAPERKKEKLLKL